jgi:hypothetical protein
MIADSRLVASALDALEEVAAATHEGPVKRTWALRLVLAYLASRARHGSQPARWPFDHFWRSIATVKQQDRWGNTNAALNAIYLAVGEKRDRKRVSLFEQRARR